MTSLRVPVPVASWAQGWWAWLLLPLFLLPSFPPSILLPSLPLTQLSLHPC